MTPAGRRDVVVDRLEPLPDGPAGLGRLEPGLRRLAAQQGGWPVRAPRNVARIGADPGRTAGLSPTAALDAGAAAADRLVDSGVDLVVVGGAGVSGAEAGRTPTLVLLAVLLDRDPVSVTGTTGSPGWAELVTSVRDGLRRARPHLGDAAGLLEATGAVEVAELTGLLLQCAVRRTGVLLSGAADVWAAALVAQQAAPHVGDWLLAGCSPQSEVVAAALTELQLSPLLDLELDDPAGAELALGVLLGAVDLSGPGAAPRPAAGQPGA